MASWATNEPAVVSITGRGVLDVTVWQQERSVTVHLVNLTNPMMMKGPFRELIPVDTQEVRIRVPRDAQAREVHLLVAAKTPEHKIAEGFNNILFEGTMKNDQPEKFLKLIQTLEEELSDWK